MPRVRSFLFSFQTKLVLAMTGVIVIAIFAAGAIFVARDRADREQRALNRIAASSPIVYQQALITLSQPADEDRDDDDDEESPDLTERLSTIAKEQDVRILIVTSEDVVLYDTGEKLTGKVLPVPASSASDYRRGFVAWQPADDFPEKDLTFVSASSRSGFDAVGVRGTEVVPFRIILAVQSDTIAEAWQSVLPSLLIAAMIAIPLALVAAILLAGQVSTPVRRLTAASEAMALGDFSQRVEVDREDEVGRLARAFTAMAQRVGLRDQQMRALLANVSHDLKTPMTSITGYAQALVDGTADDEDVRHIGQVLGEEAHHVNTLLSDLLYLGEIDAGQVITKREDVDLDDVLGRCVRRIEPLAKAKAIDVRVDLEPDLVLRDTDPDKLERALTNVLDNAAKFTPQNGEITVLARRENGKQASRVVCTVTNSGSSIAQDDLDRIFDRFFRADRARRTASGSGLGLSIARELVELNRGKISASNETGGGVTFTLRFPG